MRRGLNDGHVRRARGGVVPEHDAGFGPAARIRILQARHLGNEDTVAVHSRVRILELIGIIIDIRTAAPDCPDAVRVPGRTCYARCTDICIAPPRWQICPRRNGHQ